MAYVINNLDYSCDFLLRFRYASSNLQEYNKLMLDTARENSDKPLHKSINDPTKQAFFMAQLQMTIVNIQGMLQGNILAAINPKLGSRSMKERLASNSFWFEQSQTYNLPAFRIAEAVGLRFLNINALTCFTTSPAGTSPYLTFQQNKLMKERSIIHEFTYGNEEYIKSGEDNLCDYNGEIRSIVNRYTHNCQHIYVFENRISTRCGDFLCIGRSILPNYPFGHEFLYELPKLPCLLFANPNVGFEFRQMYLEAGNVARSKFHALTFYGDIINMSYGELAGRDIFFICSPDRYEWDNMDKVLKVAHKYGIKSVAIYPFPIIGKSCYFGDRPISDESRNMLNQATIDMSNCERITKLADHIIQKSIPEDKLPCFIKEYKLEKNNKDATPSTDHKIEFRPWSELDNGDTTSCEKITTRKLFSPENTTLIYGPSGTGKSWLNIYIAAHLASGQEFFGLGASTHAKVFYMDGEVGKDFAPRIRQLSKDFNDREMELLNQNLYVRAFAESKELLGRKEQILSILKIEKPNVFIIDNILSLAPQSWRGSGDILFDFLREIKHMGIAPIIVHHTAKGGDDYLGSVSLGSLSQNILRLEDARGTTSCLPDTEKSRLCVEMKTISEAEADKGPLVRLWLEKTKVAPYWLNESCLVWLPIGKSWCQMTMWPEIPCQVEKHEEVGAEIGASVEKRIVCLPPDEREVAKFIFSTPGGVKRKELDKKFGWEEQKSMDVLNKLIGTGLVVPEGEGKGRFYRPNH